MVGPGFLAAGWVASAVITKLVDRGRSYLSDNYDLHTETINRLTNLESQLPRILTLIEAAEKRQITNEHLDIWLKQLKDALREAEDVLDYFEAKRIRKSIKGKGKLTEIASSSAKTIKTLFFSDNDLKELKSVVSKLNKLCMDDFIITLQLFHRREVPLCNVGRETRSNLRDITIFGRDREINLILDMIFNVQHGDPNLQQGNGEGSSSFWDLRPRAVKSFLGLITHWLPNFIQTSIMSNEPEPHSITVIPIIGVGGVGKSTVAKTIYNNEKLKKNFALRAWVYVSENCDANKIMQNIYCSFEDRTIDPNMSLQNAGDKLQKIIANRRFLFILDDLRDRPELNWSELVSVLCYGAVGSVVVVTTQSRRIANTIRTLPVVTLECLDQASFWELFEYYAFAGSNNEELKEIGKQIAEKLYRLPLAGKVIGTMLGTRLEREYWEEILGRDWWTIEGAREKILPSIAVSYNYFDPQLKQCFVFCSIFPKHYVFKMESLVQMWIAHGFIQPTREETVRLNNGRIRLEDIGRKWFGKLVDEFFFQPPTLSDGNYLMHDLARDLSIAVSSNESCFVKSHDENVPAVARHVGIGCDNSEVEWKCKDSKSLRTVILFDKWRNCSAKSIRNIFAKYNGLRVLNLSGIVLETNTLVDAACQLSHLRFVDLSFTGIESIPDKFCNLCHLEVLDVRGCNFKKLPKGMNKLINLRHLYASSDTISLIYKIGKLTKLQEIEELRIGERKGHRISELMDMNEISGHLLLSNLNNVSSKEEAAKSQLDKKKYLKSLELRFEYNDRGPRTEVKMEVLNALKPGPKLEILKVGGCRWESFPGWVFSPHHGSNNLKAIHVHSFWLTSLPAFGELPSLELLSFEDLPLIEKVGSEFYGSSDVVFPSLKEVTFSRMSSWREWSDAEAGRTIFPNLKKLHMEKCCVLKELPTDSFRSTVVELILSQYCQDLNIETILQGLPSLVHLSIKTEANNTLSLCCTSLESLEDMHLEVMYPEVMGREDMIQLYFVGGLKSLVNLRKLVIIGFDEILESYEVVQENDEISEEEFEDVVLENYEIYEEQCLQFLTYLHLCYEKHICSTHSLPRVGRLSSLSTLLIEYSPAMEYTRDEESWFHQLTSLETLEFRNCLMLRCLPSTLLLLTSLKKLHIFNCPCMISLPENGLQENLLELHIDKCPDLIPRCQPNQGVDWHKISHIRSVHLDGEMITV